MVHRLALRLVEHLRMLTAEIDELATEITERVTLIAASLLAIVGCGPLTAAKIIGETAQVRRFRSKGAFARSQWHRTATSLIIKQTATPIVAHRESATQRCPAPHRDDSGTAAPTRP